MKPFTIVAIDGAAASGKTTTSKRIADKYGFLRVSTGEHYRAITYELLNNNISFDDQILIQEQLNAITLGSLVNFNKSIITINGKPVKEEFLRSRMINQNVAQFSQIPCIRKFLFNYQREQGKIAQKHGFYGLVIEGRDTTGIIFPDADLRFFLHAELTKREQRRNKENEVDCISCRDSVDKNVITCQQNVIQIDTGYYNLQQVEDIISLYIEEL